MRAEWREAARVEIEILCTHTHMDLFALFAVTQHVYGYGAHRLFALLGRFVAVRCAQ